MSTNPVSARNHEQVRWTSEMGGLRSWRTPAAVMVDCKMIISLQLNRHKALLPMKLYGLDSNSYCQVLHIEDRAQSYLNALKRIRGTELESQN
jgi:hypothetical protein